MWRSRMFRFAALGQEFAGVDGLRAIAVLAVIGFHANPSFMPGGFVGVDIFFVISGFLISSLILAGVKDGSFSFLEFYARRIRRLFPALIVVLLATWGLGWFILPPTEYAELGRHTLAGAGFAANILNYAEVGYSTCPPLPNRYCTCGRWASRNSSTSSFPRFSYCSGAT